MSGYLCELRTHFPDVRPTPTDGNMRFVSISNWHYKMFARSWIWHTMWSTLEDEQLGFSICVSYSGFYGQYVYYDDVRHSIDWLCCFFLPTYWLATGWLRQYLNWCVPLVSLLLHNSYTIKCDQCTQHTRNETEKTTKFGTSLVNRCQYLLMKDDLEIISLFFLLVIQVERIILCTKIP